MPSPNVFVRSLFVVSVCSIAAMAQAKPAYTVLHDFAGEPGDGAYPLAAVSFDAAGNLYGTTYVGGANGLGALFTIGNSGKESILYSFGSGIDGAFPRSQPTIDQAAGDIYGNTAGGGGSNDCDGGCGTIWEYSAGGAYKVLHNFSFSDGSQPRGKLLRDTLGNFYGAATNGGTDNEGTVFRYAPDGTFTVLHSFTGSEGAYPECSLIRDRAGNLYGTTEGGGAHGAGTVFKIAADGSFTTLYSFSGGADGANPAGGLDRDRAGNLYGTAENGGAHSAGSVFKLTPGGSLTALYSFSGGSDGAYPQGDMLRIGGKLYGTASSGGDANGDGLIYKVDIATGRETVLHSFDGTDGSTPVAALARMHGKKQDTLYGTAAYGGANGDGVVFSVSKK